MRKFQDMKSKQEGRKIFAMPIYSAEVHDNTQHEAAASKLTNLCPARPWRVFFFFDAPTFLSVSEQSCVD